MSINAKQIKMIRAILHAHGLSDTPEKEATVREYTGGRTTHIAEMTHRECNALVTAFQGDTGRQRMVNKLLSLAHDMGWEVEDGKVDMQRINAWCQNYSPAKVPLDKITTHELGRVLTVFERVHQSFMKSI